MPTKGRRWGRRQIRLTTTFYVAIKSFNSFGGRFVSLQHSKLLLKALILFFRVYRRRRNNSQGGLSDSNENCTSKQFKRTSQGIGIEIEILISHVC